MSNIKEGIRRKLRFNPNSTKISGLLSIEQLYDLHSVTKEGELDISILDEMAQALDAKLIKTSQTSYAKRKNSADATTQLMRDIVVEVIEDIQNDFDKRINASEIRQHNRKIDELIAKKTEDAMNNLSVEELIKLRK